MVDIKTTIAQRDKLFNDQTHIIFDRISHTLDGIQDFLVHTDPSYELGIFYWEDVSTFEELLMLVGIVKYKAGDTVILDGEMIKVTDENCKYYDRILRIGIPLSVVKEQKSEAVYDFLSQLHTAINEEPQLTEPTGQDTTTTNNHNTETYNNDEYQFDLDTLSDEQKEKLYGLDLRRTVN